MLHLRETLKEEAEDCERAGATDAAFSVEGQVWLSSLRQNDKVFFQEHTIEMKSLVCIAFKNLPIFH